MRNQIVYEDCESRVVLGGIMRKISYSHMINDQPYSGSHYTLICFTERLSSRTFALLIKIGVVCTSSYTRLLAIG